MRAWLRAPDKHLDIVLIITLMFERCQEISNLVSGYREVCISSASHAADEKFSSYPCENTEYIIFLFQYQSLPVVVNWFFDIFGWSAKSAGKVYAQSKFGSIQLDSEMIFLCVNKKKQCILIKIIVEMCQFTRILMTH